MLDNSLEIFILSGSYDMILERIIGFLDGSSIECCTKVSKIWKSYFEEYFRTPRISRLMTLHWKEFVPAQTEIRYN